VSVQRYGVAVAAAGAVIKAELLVEVFTIAPSTHPAVVAAASNAHATVEVFIVSDVFAISLDSSTLQSSVVPAG
jgi:hypothetical protein